MRHYAIGAPGDLVRMVVQVSDITCAHLNCADGEVAIEVDGPTTGLISDDGLAILPAPIDWNAEADRIRAYRTALLARCDFTILPDSPMTPEKRAEWAAYRQALRDLPKDQDRVMFADVVWPIEP